MSNPKFTSVSVTPEARDALRRLAVAVSAGVAERVSMSDAILTAEKLALRHSPSIAGCATEAGVIGSGDPPGRPS